MTGLLWFLYAILIDGIRLLFRRPPKADGDW